MQHRSHFIKGAEIVFVKTVIDRSEKYQMPLCRSGEAGTIDHAVPRYDGLYLVRTTYGVAFWADPSEFKFTEKE